jgi:hypothetical protein
MNDKETGEAGGEVMEEDEDEEDGGGGWEEGLRCINSQHSYRVSHALRSQVLHYLFRHPTTTTDGRRLRDFYHNCTNSIDKEIVGNCRCIVPNFFND